MLSNKLLCIVVLFVILDCGYSKIAPDYINICPGLKSECLKKSVQDTIGHFVKGLPNLGINTTDPLYKDRIDWVLPGGLKVEFTDGVMRGLKGCVVDSANMEGLEAKMNVTCSLTLKGKYKATGNILLFSINGDGDAKIKTPNITLSATAKFIDRTRDGVVYREIKEYKVNYVYNERVSFSITNLLKGNPEISKTILKFLNENWQLMVDEFGKPIIDTLIRLAFDVVKQFMRAIPKDELFIL